MYELSNGEVQIAFKHIENISDQLKIRILFKLPNSMKYPSLNYP